MNICHGTRGRFHEEVAYAGVDCPACEALDERDEAQERLADANHALMEMDRLTDSLVAQEARTMNAINHAYFYNEQETGREQ